MTLRLSRWRLLRFHAQRDRCFRARGLGPVYRWLYKHALIEAVDGLWTRITPAGIETLVRADAEHQRHGRVDPWATERRGTEP